MNISLFLLEVIDHYNLTDITIPDDYIYIKTLQGMYNPPQAGILANKPLAKQLAQKGYYQVIHMSGLWHHVWCSIMFCLVLDDFGVSCVGKHNVDHLLDALKQYYAKITTDWEGRLYHIVMMDRQCNKCYVDMSTPGYIEETLRQFNHSKPNHP